MKSDHPVQPKRKQKLSEDQLHRKRVSDREAQRTAREKTRAHVAHLEGLVRALQDGQDGRHHLLIQQLDQKNAEITRLQHALSSITRIAAVCRHSTEDAPTGEDSLLRPTSCDSHDTQSPGRMPGISESGVEDSSLTISPSRHVSTEEQSTRPIEAHSTTQDPGQPLSIAQLASSIIKKSDLDGRCWLLAGTLLSHLSKTRGQYLLSTENDEDIVIRAVFEGWSAVMERYPIDRGFQWLKELDENIYFAGSLESRVVHLRNCRLQFLHQMDAEAGWNHSLPEFFEPRPAQLHVPHDPLLEYFPWPGFRERVLFSPRRYATNQFMEALAQNIRFAWPHDSHDVYTKDAVSEKYRYSALFNQKVMDFSCYTATASFFDNFPELRADIPQHKTGSSIARSVCFTVESESPETQRAEHDELQ